MPQVARGGDARRGAEEYRNLGLVARQLLEGGKANERIAQKVIRCDEGKKLTELVSLLAGLGLGFSP